jgi:hypothetical protein
MGALLCDTMREIEGPMEVPSMPALSGILETALHVEDIERSARFYESVFGLQLMAGERGFARMPWVAAMFSCCSSEANHAFLSKFPEGAFLPMEAPERFTMRFPSKKQSWMLGRSISLGAAWKSKVACAGRSEEKASIFAIRTVILGSWRLRGSGPSIKKPTKVP